MVNDVSRAYMYAPCRQELFVRICDEEFEGREKGQWCWRLRRAMYGTRSAAQDWQMEAVNTLVSLGFEQGRSSPCLFRHAARGVSTLVHGDDFVSSGFEIDLRWLDQGLREKYALKTSMVGEAHVLKKEVRVLNRIIRWHCGKGATIEADPRHAQILINELCKETDKLYPLQWSGVMLMKRMRLRRRTLQERRPEESLIRK